MWESNPPFDSLGAESPALKAGTVTGPFSPPQCNHIISKLSIEAALRTCFPDWLWRYRVLLMTRIRATVRRKFKRERCAYRFVIASPKIVL